MIYEVFVVPAAKRRIRKQVEYIATVQGAPETAAKWLARIFDQIDGLSEMPRRFAVAVEDGWRDYEIRHLAPISGSWRARTELGVRGMEYGA